MLAATNSNVVARVDVFVPEISFFDREKLSLGRLKIARRLRDIRFSKSGHFKERRLKMKILNLFRGMGDGLLMIRVKGGEKVYHCGGGIVYHRHDEKGLNWESGGIRSGAGVRSSGVSQESTGSSDTWEAALCRLCLRR